MQIFKDHQHRLMPGQPLQLPEHRLQRPLFLALGVQIEWREAPPARAMTATRPEVTKCLDLTHKRTNHELRPPYERHRGTALSGRNPSEFPWPVARRSRHSGAIKAAVCRTFGPIAAL